MENQSVAPTGNVLEILRCTMFLHLMPGLVREYPLEDIARALAWMKHNPEEVSVAYDVFQNGDQGVYLGGKEFIQKMNSNRIVSQNDRNKAIAGALQIMTEMGSPRRHEQRVYPTRLYLMRDDRNGMIKIGISAKPNKREKTLQSEQPAITLLFHRAAMSNEEEALHSKYSEKRVRGEWFKLTAEDITEITGGAL